MNIHKKYKFLFILFFLLNILISNTYSQGGLMFRANDHAIGERTSYNVFENESPEFNGHLYINFKISLWDTQNLGYIFNLTTNSNSYSFNYIYSYNQPSLNFNIDGKSNKLRYIVDSAKLKNGSWFTIKFDFNLKEDRLIINIDTQNFQLSNLGLTDNIKPKLIFGKNQNYSEVPQMSISDLEVGDNNKKYYFPLNEWSGNAVHASSGKTIGYVQNPVWLMDSFYYWKLAYSKEYDQMTGLNFDPVDQRLLIYGKDSLLFFNCINGHIKTRQYQNNLPVEMILGKSIFNSKENKLYVYEAKTNTKNGISIASLDMNKLEWQSVGKAELKERMHHHNVFYDKNFDSIYIFGGYGGYRYYNNIYAFDKRSDVWELVKFTGDTITPRFLSACGNSNNPEEIFIFGGYGNESGNQVVGGRLYYDLYRVNLKSHIIKRCWNIHTNDNFVPTNNLILSPDHKYIYALCYPHGITKTFLRLYKFSVENGSFEILGSPIPFTAERIETDVNLFLNEYRNELICAVQEFLDSRKSKIRIYTIAYPPIRMAKVSSIKGEIVSKPTNREIIFLIGSGLLLIIIFLLIIYKRKSRHSRVVVTVASANPEEEAVLTDVEEIGIENRIKPDAQKNAIYLLGDFNVLDRKGLDITHLFSPKIKQLFILIMLNSCADKGINTKKISNILWPDKDIVKTRNIKAVTLNHLRNILVDIDGINLVFSEDSYFFTMAEDLFCDYYILLKAIQNNTSENKSFISDYFNLICRGVLLKDMQEDWVETFKNAYEHQIIECLSANMEQYYLEKKYSFILFMCKTILNIDPFNDVAFRYMVNAYRKTKGLEYSRKTYNQFLINYEKSLGESYNVTFDEILIP